MSDDTGRIRKPWWKRPEITVPSICALIGSGLFSGLPQRIYGIWESPVREVRLEHRVMLIEHALKIVDPDPFTEDVTNIQMLARMGETNTSVTIDP